MNRSGPEKIDHPHQTPGLEDFEAGTHVIVECTAAGNYGSGMTAKCKCGFEFHFQWTTRGRADLRGKRNWSAHLEAVRQPDLILPMGTVARPNWDEDVMVTSLQYALGVAKRPKYVSGSWALLIVRSNGKNIIAGSQHDRDAVIGKAHNYIRKAELEGHDVDRAAPPDLPPEATKARAIRLLNTIDAALDPNATLLTIDEALAEVDEFLRLAPLVESRRTQLAAERERRLVAPRRAAAS